MIASTTLFSKFTYFAVDDFDISDHLPVYCRLTLHERPKVVTFDDSQATKTNAWEKYRWNREMKDTFLAKFRDNFLMFLSRRILEMRKSHWFLCCQIL